MTFHILPRSPLRTTVGKALLLGAIMPSRRTGLVPGDACLTPARRGPGETARSSRKCRKPRSGVVTFDEGKLFNLLVPAAKVKQDAIAFKWDGSHYYKPKRSLGPDRQGLADGSPVLDALVSVAENAYPRHKNFVRVWFQLQAKFNVFGLDPAKATDEDVNILCIRSSDNWRTQLRHCVELKKSLTKGGKTSTVASTELQHVLDGIVLSTMTVDAATATTTDDDGRVSATATTDDDGRLSHHGRVLLNNDGFPDIKQINDASDGDQSSFADDDDDDNGGDDPVDGNDVAAAAIDNEDGVTVVGVRCRCTRCFKCKAVQAKTVPLVVQTNRASTGGGGVSSLKLGDARCEVDDDSLDDTKLVIPDAKKGGPRITINKRIQAEKDAKALVAEDKKNETREGG